MGEEWVKVGKSGQSEGSRRLLIGQLRSILCQGDLNIGVHKRGAVCQR